MEKQMATILSCEVTDCAYNRHNSCHTLAITVGGKEDECPKCDTFLSSSHKGGIQDMKGGVGACKVDICTFNDSLECSTNNIKVGKHQGHPDCLSFKAR